VPSREQESGAGSGQGGALGDGRVRCCCGRVQALLAPIASRLWVRGHDGRATWAGSFWEEWRNGGQRDDSEPQRRAALAWHPHIWSDPTLCAAGQAADRFSLVIRGDLGAARGPLTLTGRSVDWKCARQRHSEGWAAGLSGSHGALQLQRVAGGAVLY
jgi:hypothetical protein